MINILLFLWGETSGPKGRHAQWYEFGPRDVMRLGAQIRANLRLPHRLTVISDWPREEFAGDFAYLPLMEHFGDVRPLGGCWLRLKCFSRDLQPVLGKRWAWIDLDSVVVGPLDPLLSRKEPLVLYKSDSIVGQRWNGSFLIGGPGNEDIWDDFDSATTPQFCRELRKDRSMGGPRGTDQAWLHYKRGPETPHVTMDDGIIHWATRRCRRLPDNARLVTFPGTMKMSDPRVQRVSPWLGQFFPFGSNAAVLPDVEPWSAVPDMGGQRIKSVMAMRRQARQIARLQRIRV